MKMPLLTLSPMTDIQIGPQSQRSPLAAQNVDLSHTSQPCESSPPALPGGSPVPGQFTQPLPRSAAILPQGFAPARHMGTVSLPESHHSSTSPPQPLPNTYHDRPGHWGILSPSF